MDWRGNRGINLYESYRRQVHRERSDKSKRRARWIVPLAALALALLVFAGVMIGQNIKKSMELDQLRSQSDALQPAYEQASALSQRRAELENIYGSLAYNHLLFALYPALSEALVTQVRDCALDGTIFTIHAYAYDEENLALVLDASAESVNEVPLFVERLRQTQVFRSVVYTGYTSDQDSDYFCTVGCTLNVNEQTDEQTDELGGVSTQTELTSQD